MNRIEEFKKAQETGLNIFIEKDKRYGSSFFDTCNKHGLVAPVIRLEDKVNRLAYLVHNPEDSGNDESIKDTLRDLSNYAIMTLVAIEELEMKSCKESGRSAVN